MSPTRATDGLKRTGGCGVGVGGHIEAIRVRLGHMGSQMARGGVGEIINLGAVSGGTSQVTGETIVIPPAGEVGAIIGCGSDLLIGGIIVMLSFGGVVRRFWKLLIGTFSQSLIASATMIEAHLYIYNIYIYAGLDVLAAGEKETSEKRRSVR